MTQPTAPTPPRGPNYRQQTAYSSLSDADLWGKIRTKSGHGDPLWLRGLATGSDFPDSPALMARVWEGVSVVQFDRKPL
jgi:hypothetical protein